MKNKIQKVFKTGRDAAPRRPVVAARRPYHSLIIALTLLVLLSTIIYQPSTLHAQGTAFMYQGQLQNNGSPASGTYNLTFSLFGTNITGVPIAGPVTNNAVFVTNGLFTVQVDFGSGVFTGATNWLQIGVETNGVNTFTTVAPRQQITPVPYAIYAENAGTVSASQLTSIGNTNVGAFNNFFVGPSGNSTTTGNNNTANGDAALYANTSGSLNTANGYEALSNNLIGAENTANGALALYSNTGGNGNTANGLEALYNNIGGYGNTANGGLALFANTSGFYNTANGYLALYSNTIGAYNIALGFQAGYDISTGSSNIDIGNLGFGTDTNLIRIGSGQSQTFIAGVINGNGGGLTNLNASQVAGGLPGLTIQQNAAGAPNLIGGSSDNFVSGGKVGATIGGGGATNYLGLGVAFTNSVTDDFGTVGGGAGNTAGYAATVGGGNANTASGEEATVGGGIQNTASSLYTTVSGGYGNTASGELAAMGGGYANTASGLYATVSGGQTNTASGNWTEVGGGYGNTANNIEATVGGGYRNTAGNQYATVGGGYTNTATGQAAAVAGGAYNTASGDLAAVGGGYGNSASGNFSTVGGGNFNTNSGGYATVGGGNYNTASAAWATVGGGNGNNASGTGSFIGGGGMDGTTIIYSGNQAQADDATIGGGLGNNILSLGSYAFIGGGYSNTVTATYATVGGGTKNTALGQSATVGGGVDNTASYIGATVAGGGGNTASGYYATVAGGTDNTASGDYSFAAGYGAQATYKGSFVWADSQGGYFNSTENDQVSFRCAGGVTFTSGGSGSGSQTVFWTPGSGSWMFVSDRNAKDRFVAVDVGTVLDKVAQLPISEWSYRGYGQRHIGAMAQDFHALFPLNDNDKVLNDADLHGVELAAIQGLDEKVESGKQKAEMRMEKLEAENAELKQRLEALEKIVLNQKSN